MLILERTLRIVQPLRSWCQSSTDVWSDGEIALGMRFEARLRNSRLDCCCRDSRISTTTTKLAKVAGGEAPAIAKVEALPLKGYFGERAVADAATISILYRM